MFYIEINKDFIDLTHQFGVNKLYVEVDSNGIPKREIGMDYDNNVIHKFPSPDFKYGAYGILD